MTPGGLNQLFLALASELWQECRVSTLVVDLQNTLEELDENSASKLEQLIRDAMALASVTKGAPPTEADSNGWPAQYFERTFGCLTGLDFEAPDDAPAEPLREW